MPSIAPHFWFERNAAEAAAFYVSLFPDSRIDSVSTSPSDTPSGPAGSVEIVAFTLAGRPYKALSAGPLDPFNHAISMFVTCEDQAEVDRLWAALSEDGAVEQCGWLRDRYGVAWQIVPKALEVMMGDPDRARAKRVMDAMLTMVKLDVAALERAYAG
jgi:predicted 3-demethylubiquinone-9 3-methyltransferase (glyoxalase superfamily)